MYDPIELAEKTERIVVKDDQRKYYRFRTTRFYGGSATADAVGCNLRCVFCWSERPVRQPQQIGRFYTPKAVAEELLQRTQNQQVRVMRISGAEPTIGRTHLLSLLEQLKNGPLFILETNGILLGHDKTYVRQLSTFHNLHVRVSLKGCSKEEFTWLTNATQGFEYQLKALAYLKEYQISFNPAVVSIRGDTNPLLQRLHELGLDEMQIEWEHITLYPPVQKRLKQTGMLEFFS
jgi:uncharacterized Fe-S cluster-containing radical SAM superfamily protein